MTTLAYPTLNANAVPESVEVLGLPITPMEMSDVIAAVNDMIERRKPVYFITANLNYAMLCAKNPEMDAINREAAFVLADGMPLVWAAHKAGTPLPGRVTGSDLIFELSAEAARQGHRVFLLGGADGVAAAAAERLTEKFPGLIIAGIEVPPFRAMSPEEEEAMFQRIREAKPDLLLAAFSQPRGEKWIAANHERLGVPVCAQMGASIDFAAGRVKRAPRLIQRIGMEWAFRLSLEPRRLWTRYFRNGLFLARQLL